MVPTRSIVAGLLVLLAGCGVTAIQDLPMPDQGVELSDPSLARLYIYRETTAADWLSPLAVYIDGQRLGVIGNGDYLCIELAPGARLISLALDRAGAPDTTGEDYITLKAGRATYYEVEFSTGTRWPKLKHVTSVEGREEVADRDPAPSGHEE